MAWKIDLSSNALRQLRKLDKPIANRILKFLRGRIEKLDDPRKIERLQGPLGDFWKYRVGDYRVICSLQDDKLVVWVVRIGHRSEVYSR